MSSLRVLVVEDFAPFWQVIRSTLAEKPDIQVIGEVADGLEAVQKAELLEPDLVLLDIGLPTLNGIEVARRIRKLSPKSKILFVSQESAADVVGEALRIGALGYIIKTHIGSELLAAVGRVRQGRQFIGSGLPDRHFMDSADPLVSKGDEQTHIVQFYADDNFWSDNVCEFLCTALNEGKSVIVCALAHMGSKRTAHSAAHLLGRAPQALT